jgi:hypothetical protein
MEASKKKFKSKYLKLLKNFETISAHKKNTGFILYTLKKIHLVTQILYGC